jgi:hypothetical protein
MTLRNVFGAVVISIALSGCFGAYQVSPSDPLGVGGLKPTQEDKDAGLVGIAPGFNLKDYEIIAVERIPVAKSEIEDAGDQRFADTMAAFYQSEVVRRLRETGLFSRVVNLSETDFPTGAGKALRLHGTITRLDRGSQAARYLVGFGAGSTRAQTEMHFADAESGRVVIVTADRRLGSMGLFGGDDEEFLRESFNNMARDLAKFLTRLTKGEGQAALASGAANADNANVAGKWLGTVTTGTFGGGSVDLELNLVQSDKKVSGTIAVRNRPFNPKNWDGPITGAVSGRSVTVEYWTPESRKVVATLTLAADGMLNGPGRVEGTLTTAEFKLQKSK